MTVLSLGLLLLSVAIVLGVLSIPLMRGAIPPNWWYGFRTPATVHSMDLWYPTNRFAGRQLLLASGLQALVGVALIVLRHRLTPGSAAAIALTVFSLTILVTIVRSFARLRRLKQSQSVA
jgi:uncharacterized membrane protein